MAIVKKRKLSESIDGLPILLTSKISASADTIHTSTNSTTDGTYDEVWLWAFNTHSTNILLTIEFGNNTQSNNININIPSSNNGLTPIVPGFILQNSKTIKAFASIVDKISIVGFINTIQDV